MKVKGLVFFLTALLLLATPVMAVHTHGKGGYASVETDGYDDGYYLVVWSNSTSSGLAGVFGKLYHVYNNSPASDVIQIYTSRSAFQTAIASSKMDNTQKKENVYLVVWHADDDYPYARLLGYDGSFITGVIKLSNVKFDSYYGQPSAGYGNGSFIAAWESSSDYSKLYYVVFNTIGQVTDNGTISCGSDCTSWHYTSKRIAYNSNSGYFGVVTRARISGAYKLALVIFKLTGDGKVDNSTIKVITPDVGNPNIKGTIITATNQGFLIGFKDKDNGYKWTLLEVQVDSSGNAAVGNLVTYQSGYGADIDFVENGTADYLVFAQDNNTDIFLYKLKENGTEISHTIIENSEGSTRRYPAVAAKPAHSPEAYVIAWSDTDNSEAEGSEYLPDFTEVSETNQVPFFSNLAIATATLLGILWLFRRR